MQAVRKITGRVSETQLRNVTITSGHCKDGSTEYELTALASAVVRGKRVQGEIIVTANVTDGFGEGEPGELSIVATLLPVELEGVSSAILFKAAAAIAEGM